MPRPFPSRSAVEKPIKSRICPLRLPKPRLPLPGPGRAARRRGSPRHSSLRVQAAQRHPPLRRFFAAFFQSQVGTGAAYVALLLVAYQRLHSGWAISLVLLGEFLPGIVLSPLFGSLADRISRRRLAVCADLLRAVCFVAIAIVPSFAATVGFALLAGVGTALFRPAINSALPGLVRPSAARS